MDLKFPGSSLPIQPVAGTIDKSQMLADHSWRYSCKSHMHNLIDLHTYPIHEPASEDYGALVARCRDELNDSGMFNLSGFLRPEACTEAVREIMPVMAEHSFTHRRMHNIYFLDEVPGVAPGHPALNKMETINHTVCADQLGNDIVVTVYEYPPLKRFLADTMSKSKLFLMDDPLARINVMSYREGEALNWHFDRSEFTITLLLQAPVGGGEFQYRPSLRNEHDPNFDGVACLMAGRDRNIKTLMSKLGSLTVFRGKNTAHRITPVEGAKERMIAVYSYYEFPGKVFTEEERIGFYGRAS